jgi:hypothetical protein
MKLAVGLLVVVILTAGAWFGYQFLAPTRLAACDEAIKLRLVAPATYTRISASEQVVDVSLDEYQRRYLANLTAAERARLKPGEIPPVLEFYLSNFQKGTLPTPRDYNAYVTYDASNRLGVPIRSVAACTMDANEDIPKAAEVNFWVKIDGDDYTQWLTKSLAQAPN